MRAVWFTGTCVLLAAGACVAVGQQRQGGIATPIPPASSSRTNFPPMGGGISPMGPMGPMDASGVPDVMNSRIAEQQARTRNSDRQKRLESDTDKLVGLVDEFKQQIQDKELSPAAVSKRAEEIEKLAKSVKDRMRG